MNIFLETVHLSKMLIRLWCLTLQVALQPGQLFVSLYVELSKLKNKQSLKRTQIILQLNQFLGIRIYGSAQK